MTTRLTAAVLLCLSSVPCQATLVDLTNGGSLGGDLDEITISDLGTSAAGPFDVPGFSSLQVTVTGFGPDGKVNATGSALGIDSSTSSGGGDSTFRFDADLNEFITFSFSESILLEAVDFESFTSGEAFAIGSLAVPFSATSGSVLTLATPLTIAGGTEITFQATSGSIGVQSISISLAAVPEPTAALFGSLIAGALGLTIARRPSDRD